MIVPLLFIRRVQSVYRRVPSAPRTAPLRGYAYMWRFQAPFGQRVKVGALLRGVLQNYAPDNYPPSQLISDALEDCDQLELTRTEGGNLWPLTTGKMFNCADLHAALEDPEPELELRIIVAAVPPEDWTAVSMLARAYWPAPSRWPIGNRLHALGDV